MAKYPKTDFELTTSEVPLCAYIRKIFPKSALGLIMQKFIFEDWMPSWLVEEKIIGWADMTKADIVHLPFVVLGRFGGGNIVRRLNEVGVDVHAHIPRTDVEHKQLAIIREWGVDQCTFDNIDLLGN